jgi:hypothetical protein
MKGLLFSTNLLKSLSYTNTTVCLEKGHLLSYNKISSSLHYLMLTLERVAFKSIPIASVLAPFSNPSTQLLLRPLSLPPPQTFYVTQNFVSSHTHLQHPRETQSVTLKTGTVFSSQNTATFTYYKVRYSNPITDLDRPYGFQEVEPPRF